LQVADRFEPGSGNFLLGAGVVGGVGTLSADLTTRVSENVSLFAKSHIDTNKEFGALAGLRVTW
tara:strand:+ start:1261 stop:1452 length:192 start_codon:yes stop_codon:yes gene_type:complete